MERDGGERSKKRSRGRSAHLEPCRRLVDQVDTLVRLLPLGEEPTRELGGRDERVILYGHAMVDLVL